MLISSIYYMSDNTVFQIIDHNFHTRGIYDDLEKAKDAALSLRINGSSYYQVNRIPLNTVGQYGEIFDAVWLSDGRNITESP